MHLHSPAFEADGTIPALYTCDGKDCSPPLRWSDAPAATQSFALIVDDPDAPDPAEPRTTWVHWVVYNLPASCGELPESAAQLPSGTCQGLNDWRRTGYSGPCPPVGRHRYFFKLYALDVSLTGLDKPTKRELELAMRGHVLAQAALVATYARGC